jgi:hypothetical protein
LLEYEEGEFGKREMGWVRKIDFGSGEGGDYLRFEI